MTAVVYTIASGKGGTGKTTTTANLGTALAALGKRVVILDADIGMANLGLVMGLEKHPITLHEVLSGNARIEDAIYAGPAGVMVAPCGVSLKGFQNSNPERLKDVMGSLVEQFDIMLIDAPAGISKDAVIPMAIADEVILVVNPEISSMADALKTKVLTEMVGGKVMGAIVNRAGMEKVDIPKQKVAELLNTVVIGVIPEDANVRRAAAFKTPLVVNTPKSPAAVAYKKIAAKLGGVEYKEGPTNNGKKESFVEKLAKSLFGGKK
ncbi:MAG: cell division ATPase MinD, archaeal [Candidatus Syntrophoarchaeum caldarius]|uniref:Cell division ATPase MinD, archaeal n=1 Tax=Candidatus Syntropharchaeum caldarium TaxID=1838285 RepID=A0A1F2PAN7_9EURY|nr:MAG: cell division ATPase MinD, archaeal [Candidatus Syntrophoarchaeum caldarius]